MTSKRLLNGLTAAAVLVLGAAASPAAAGDGQWHLRVSGLLLDTGGGIAVETGAGRFRTSIDTGAGLGVSIERRLNERLGFELGVMATAPGIDVGGEPDAFPWWGSTDLMSITPITFGVNVHLTPDEPVDVHVGAMLAYVVYSDLRVDTVPGISIDWDDFPFVTVDSGTSVRVGSDVDLAWGLDLGVDLRFGDGRWSAHARISYLETDYEIGGRLDSDNPSVSFEPLIVGLGFGYRF